MAKEYIERDMVLSHKWEVRSYDPSDPDPVTEVVSVSSVMCIPAADVVEVRHGRWINERWEGLSSFSAECSLCGKRTLAYFHYFFCPNCGAKMDGGQDDV